MSNFQQISEAMSKILNVELRRNAEMMSAFYQKLNDQINSINHLYYNIPIPDIYRQLPQFDVSAFNQAAAIAANISSVAESFSFQVDNSHLKRQVEILTSGMNEMAKRVAVDLAAINIAYQDIFSNGLFKHVQEVVKVKKDEVTAFCAAGWPISPSMPSELRKRVVNLHDQGKTRYVSQTIIGYYRRNNHINLIEMVEEWREHHLLKPRFHILSDALDAHRNGKYTLSVPALIPQIEGVLNDYVKKNNLVARFGKIQEIYTAAIGNTDDYGMAEWAIVQTLLHLLQTSTYAYTSFNDELNKSVRKRATTRHTVLHGVTVHYNQPAHSLKSFLLIDAISVLA